MAGHHGKGRARDYLKVAEGEKGWVVFPSRRHLVDMAPISVCHYDVQRIWPANYARISAHLTGSCSCTRAGEQTLTSRGTYMYMDDLLELNARRPVHRRTVPTEVGVVTTPLIARAWEVELADHPDREFTSSVVEGIEKGFRIGFNYSSSIGAAEHALGQRTPRAC